MELSVELVSVTLLVLVIPDEVSLLDELATTEEEYPDEVELRDVDDVLPPLTFPVPLVDSVVV